jgi:iron-sulfur cluster repair protein YtfE (RIC family)
MRKLEPKLARGFDVLDADHHHIEQQLYRIQTLLTALKQNEAANPALADKLAQAIEAGGGALYRHLADEEDLVIPILALRAE